MKARPSAVGQDSASVRTGAESCPTNPLSFRTTDTREPTMTLALGMGIIAVAVYAIYRQVDVRLALLPGALELRTVVEVSAQTAKDQKLPPPGVTSRRCVERILPLGLIGLTTATAVFWVLCARAEARRAAAEAAPEATLETPAGEAPPP